MTVFKSVIYDILQVHKVSRAMGVLVLVAAAAKQLSCSFIAFLICETRIFFCRHSRGWQTIFAKQ